jgi:hypothetical protein
MCECSNETIEQTEPGVLMFNGVKWYEVRASDLQGL